jgi:cysteinyl-tRNA synthetase
MDNDFNTRDAIATLFDFSRDINKYLEKGQVSRKSLDSVLSFFAEINDRLTIFQEESGVDDELLSNLVQVLIDIRQKARSDNNYALADEVRDKLKDYGIILEDTADGVRWKKK